LYTISDGVGGSATATVTVTVTSVNDAPTATGDVFSVAEDSGSNALAVLANDTAAPDSGETLTITAVTQGARGAVAIAGGGTGLTYTPNANANGADSFMYTISDGVGGSATATVSVTINPANDPPTAAANSATVAEGAAATAIDVLANDSAAPDTGETITIATVTQPGDGVVAITGGGTGLTYAPKANFAGTDAFLYTISDGVGGSATATVTVTVTSVNDAPTATGDVFSVAEDSGAGALAVLANDTSAPDSGETLTITAVTQGARGAVAITGGGTGLTYTPSLNLSGLDTFTYTIGDGNGGSATATVAVAVTPVNDTPNAVNDAATVETDSGANTIAVLANDTSAPDTGETLTITAVTQGANGTVAITGGAASVAYTPSAGFRGADSFTYTISDGSGGTDTATVNVTVQDTRGPQITQVELLRSIKGKIAQIVLTFNEAVVEAADPANYRLRDSRGRIKTLTSVGYNGTNRTATLALTKEIPATKLSQYALTVFAAGAIADAAGNALDGDDTAGDDFQIILSAAVLRSRPRFGRFGR
jgi:hypothetical protein